MIRALHVLIALAGLVPGIALAQTYTLHPQDRLLIRVVAWDFETTEQMAWEKLSGEYTITPEGQLLLPLAGPLDAAGLSLAQISTAAADMLRRAAGMGDTLHVSVELVASAPIYVMGAAQTRGAVAFRPGLTARQALALAGDIYRVPETADTARAVTLTGDVLASEDRMRRLRHEYDLVQAELAALAGDAPPADPIPPADDVQASLLQAGRASRDTRAASLDDLQDLLTSKIDSLSQQMVLRDGQIAAVGRDLQDLQSLNDKGLAANARVTALATSLTDLEARRLELESTLLLTQQQLNQAERDRGTIGFDARADLLGRLNNLQADIAAEGFRLSGARQSLMQAQLDQGIAALPGQPAPQPEFTIIRTGPDGTRTLPATADTPLVPGDTLEVSLPNMDQLASRP